MRGVDHMAKTKHGDKVLVHYTGRLDDGTVFDQSQEGEPLQFTVGAGELLPAFERAVVGMEAGDTRRTTLSVDQAYGPRRPEMVVNLDRSAFPEGITPEVGVRVQINQFDFEILEVGENEVKVDANHPLAGKELTYDIRLIEIVGDEPEEPAAAGEEAAPEGEERAAAE